MAVRVVMISSTARDLPRHREQVMGACLQQNLFPKMMENLPASDANAVEASIRMVDGADIYVGVIGFHYGYVPKKGRISITEMEYERAGKRGIPRLMFLMNDDHPIRFTDVETGPGAERLRVFRQRILEDRVIARFSSPEDLRAHVVQALSEFRVAPERVDLVASQIGSTRYRIAVINQAESVSPDEVRAVVAALQTQVTRDLAPTWGIDAQIELFGPGQTPSETAWWLYLDDDSKVKDALGYHDVNAAGLPMGRVGIRSTREVGGLWSVTASHTLLQLLGNPWSNAMVCVNNWFLSRTLCNPCEGERWGYEIDTVRVSDFVLPAWFDRYRGARSTRFDFCGHITEPFQILKGGYAIYFEKAAWRTRLAHRGPVRLVQMRGRKSKVDPKSR